MKKKLTKEEALEYCFGQITPSILTDVAEYNKFKTYRQRIKTGKAGKNAIQTLFSRFGITENCYYTVDNEK